MITVKEKLNPEGFFQMRRKYSIELPQDVSFSNEDRLSFAKQLMFLVVKPGQVANLPLLIVVRRVESNGVKHAVWRKVISCGNMYVWW